jgi:hypothetical protein
MSSISSNSNFGRFLGEHKVHPYENPYVWCCFHAFVGANLVFARALIGKMRIADRSGVWLQKSHISFKIFL